MAADTVQTCCCNQNDSQAWGAIVYKLFEWASEGLIAFIAIMFLYTVFIWALKCVREWLFCKAPSAREAKIANWLYPIPDYCGDVASDIAAKFVGEWSPTTGKTLVRAFEVRP